MAKVWSGGRSSPILFCACSQAIDNHLEKKSHGKIYILKKISKRHTGGKDLSLGPMLSLDAISVIGRVRIYLQPKRCRRCSLVCFFIYNFNFNFLASLVMRPCVRCLCHLLSSHLNHGSGFQSHFASRIAKWQHIPLSYIVIQSQIYLKLLINFQKKKKLTFGPMGYHYHNRASLYYNLNQN
jgi:hypothetical protein